MIILQNSFIKLGYDPLTAILSVDMPTVDTVNMPEVKPTLESIVEHVRDYDVKRLLVDARKTKVEVGEETYAFMVAEFSCELVATHLQKLARIVTSSPERENVVRKVYGENKLSRGAELH